MPYKDKAQATEASKERMRKHRQGVTKQGVTDEGVTWETIAIKEIKEILPGHLVKEIEALVVWDELLKRAVTMEERWRNAYKYHVWHEANFTDGIHNDSKYRAMIK